MVDQPINQPTNTHTLSLNPYNPPARIHCHKHTHKPHPDARRPALRPHRHRDDGHRGAQGHPGQLPGGGGLRCAFALLLCCGVYVRMSPSCVRSIDRSIGPSIDQTLRSPINQNPTQSPHIKNHNSHAPHGRGAAGHHGHRRRLGRLPRRLYLQGQTHQPPGARCAFVLISDVFVCVVWLLGGGGGSDRTNRQADPPITHTHHQSHTSISLKSAVDITHTKTGLEEIGEVVDIETRITAQREVADLLVEQVSACLPVYDYLCLRTHTHGGACLLVFLSLWVVVCGLWLWLGHVHSHTHTHARPHLFPSPPHTHTHQPQPHITSHKHTLMKICENLLGGVRRRGDSEQGRAAGPDAPRRLARGTMMTIRVISQAPYQSTNHLSLFFFRMAWTPTPGVF